MPSRDEINDAFVAMLENGTGKQIGLCEIPMNPEMPYAIVYPREAGADEGSWGVPHEDKTYNFQVKCVGADARQAAWMSSKVWGVMTNRTGADYAEPLELTGAAVHWRATEALGAIVPSGENLYESDDLYQIRIGA